MSVIKDNSIKELRQIALSYYSQMTKSKEEGIKIGEARIIKAMYNSGISIEKISSIVNMSLMEIESIVSNIE